MATSLLVWVLYLVMPGSIPDAAISQPMLSYEECIERIERVKSPNPLFCYPRHIDWEDLA